MNIVFQTLSNFCCSQGYSYIDFDRFSLSVRNNISAADLADLVDPTRLESLDHEDGDEDKDEDGRPVGRSATLISAELAMP